MPLTSTQRLTGAFREPDAIETLVSRERAPVPRFSLLDEMFVERGDKADWEMFADLHYKAGNLASGPRFYRLLCADEVIGVLVTSCPKGLLRERHKVFPNLRPGAFDTKMTNTNRYRFVNANFRVVSRFVIDTMYRGIGAGYRMMNLVARMEASVYEKPFIEIQSSMSKFNLFGQKAGFRFVKPSNSHKFDIGMKFMRQHFEANPADMEELIAEIEAKAPVEQSLLMDELRQFYYRHSPLEKTGSNRENGKARVAALDARGVIKALQQIILASPMYGVWKAPDKPGTVPDRLPLKAFDWQPPTEPLRFHAGGLIAPGAIAPRIV